MLKPTIGGIVGTGKNKEKLTKMSLYAETMDLHGVLHTWTPD
jgi:hypothetical protein